MVGCPPAEPMRLDMVLLASIFAVALLDAVPEGLAWKHLGILDGLKHQSCMPMKICSSCDGGMLCQSQLGLWSSR